MEDEERSVRSAVIGILFFGLLLAVAGAGVFISRYYPLRHLDIIEKYAAHYGLEPAFVCAVINAESRFNATAVSGAGASGLMQIMESTANWIAPQAGLENFSYSQIFDPDVNIRLGCYYLSMYRGRFGSLDNALCAYNAGGGNLEAWLGNPAYSSDGKTLDKIPFEETRKYIERVNDYTKVYRILLRFTGNMR